MKGMNRVKRGRGFRGVLNYIFGRDKDHKNAPGVLLGGNMSGHDPQSLAQEFGVTRRIRPDVEKPVWHNSLRLPAGESLTHDEWFNIADDYMEKMGFGSLHPRCYVLHDDKEGQHIHIAASRIALDGSLYLGKNENLASTRIIQQLEIEHGLTITKGPEYQNGKIKMPEIKNPSKPEMEKGLRLEVKPPRLVLQDLLNAAIQEPKTVMQFVKFLEENGVIVFPNVASTGMLHGFSFELGGLSFKGSSLGDAYKWSSLLRVIDYDQDRDFAELAKRKPVVGDDGRNSSGIESVAGDDWRADSPGTGTFGPSGQDAGPALDDHSAIDPRSHGFDTQPNGDAGPRPSAEVCAHGSRRTSQSQGSKSGGKRMDERSDGVTNAKNRYAGANSDAHSTVLGGNSGGGDVGRGLGVDNFWEVPVMAWNTRFKQASARKRGKSQNERQDVDREAEFERLCAVAHGADLIAYMRGLGLDIKKDGVKDWVVDGRYRITRKQDGHFVWCSWDQSRGGDPLSFCTDELGLSFQQALADLAGGASIQATKPREMSYVDRFPTSPPASRDPYTVLEYLEGRGISRDTALRAQGAGFLRLVDYQSIPAAAFCGLDGGKLRSMTVRLTQPVKSFDAEKEIMKLDIRHSDKSFPALWRGGDPNLRSDKVVWVVEGGIDALAVADWYKSHAMAAPDIIVSGGSGVRVFLDQPHVQGLLKQASAVYVCLENEKTAETQRRTDSDHEKQIDKICALGCETVIAWSPPSGTKDVAEAWQAGVLPDAHYPMAHTRQEGEGSNAATKTMQMVIGRQASTPTPFD